MNAILLGAASLGSLIAIFTAQPVSKPAVEQAQISEDVGAMTHDVFVDPQTGEETEVSVISFVD